MKIVWKWLLGRLLKEPFRYERLSGKKNKKKINKKKKKERLSGEWHLC